MRRTADVMRSATIGALDRRWMAVLLGLLVIAEFLASEPRGWFVDFKNAYYPAGVAMAEGGSLAGLIGQGVAGFVNLPIVAYAFAPFAVLAWQPAAAVALLLGLAASAAACLVLVAAFQLGAAARLGLILVFVLNGPLINSLKSGNTSQVALLAVAIALWLLRFRRFGAAGAVLGLAAVLKLPLLVLGGFFLLRRESWRGAATFAAVIAVAAALSLAVFGLPLHAQWLDVAIRQFSDKTIPAFNVQSVPAMLARWRDPAPPLFDWSMLALTPGERGLGKLIQAGIVALALAGLWFSHRAARRVPASSPARLTELMQLQLLLVVSLALLISPLAWSHYFCWLLAPAACVLGGRCGFATSVAARRLAWAGIALTTPLVLFPYRFTATLDPLYTKLAVSNGLAGGLCWLVALVLAARALQVSRPEPA